MTIQQQSTNEQSPLLKPQHDSNSTAQDDSHQDTSSTSFSTYASFDKDCEQGSKNGESKDSFSFSSSLLDVDAIINWAILLSVVGFAFTKLLLLVIQDAIADQWHWHQVVYQVPLSIWNGYTDFLTRHELLCKALTSGTVYTIGDVLAQSTEGKSIGQVERARVGRSLVAGFCGHGPVSHGWYYCSQHFFDNILGWTAWWSVIPKVFVDQTVFGPIWNNTYILLLGVMKWQSPTVIWEDMKRTTIPLIVSGLKLWPAVHVITYGVIPVQNRLLWVDFVEIVWVIMLSTQAAKGRQVLTLEQEDKNLLDEDDGSIILHSNLIPEHFYGDREVQEELSLLEGPGGYADVENGVHIDDSLQYSHSRRSSSIFERLQTWNGDHEAAPTANRRESLPTILQHRRESLLGGHPHPSHRRGSLMAVRKSVRGYYFGGQIWVI